MGNIVSKGIQDILFIKNFAKMKNLKNLISLSRWLIVCLLCFSAIEGNAQVIKMSAKDLTKNSTSVLYGKCSKVKSEWNDNKSMILTYVTVIPEEYIKGDLGPEAIITVPGGKVDNIIYEVSEMAFFNEGEDVVAFVWTDKKGRNLILGGDQGKIKIEKDSKTGKRSIVVEDPDDETEQNEQAPGQAKKAARMQLEDFVVKLKGYAKN
jgi:hypothetical protein